jgi:hypothetical protein
MNIEHKTAIAHASYVFAFSWQNEMSQFSSVC